MFYNTRDTAIEYDDDALAQTNQKKKESNAKSILRTFLIRQRIVQYNVLSSDHLYNSLRLFGRMSLFARPGMAELVQNSA